MTSSDPPTPIIFWAEDGWFGLFCVPRKMITRDTLTFKTRLKNSNLVIMALAALAKEGEKNFRDYFTYFGQTNWCTGVGHNAHH